MNEESFLFSSDILEAPMTVLGIDEMFPSRDTDMLTLFCIASGIDDHRLLFLVDERCAFLLRGALRLESGSDLDLLKLTTQQPI